MRYPGGKGRTYQRIINLMPPHRVYIETHLGGGSVLRNKRPAKLSIGIELDPAVVACWRASPLAGVEIHEADATAFLRSFPFAGDELVYSDPPYVRSTRRRARCYRFDYDDASHIALLAELKRLPCPVIISGYPSQLYADLLDGWRTVTMAVASHVGRMIEVAWLNFDPPERLHDHRHLGDDFRERERMRRKVDRWVRRLDRMAAVERNALISAVTERFPQSTASLEAVSPGERSDLAMER
jgi:site-specific DNA-adenine methylase